ncbi:ribosomal protein L10-domain-containing protein [Dipodascopsis tothii]|uniref:ribosomal protein L10-domain-containing protein n=1 Tax=Dipodascopsis tothii TaxID=44089 RepID=UPI0034CF63FE
MPKSKRSKLVTLTKTAKKGRENKEALVDEIQSALETYQYVWVFSVDSMRNTFLKEVRSQWKESRIFFGRTKVMAKALGTTVESEYKPKLSKLAAQLAGDVGLLLTNETPETVKEYFDEYTRSDFPRAGQVSSVDFTLPAGVVYSRGGQIAEDDDVPLAHSLESTLRTQLGVPSLLKNGQVVLENEHVVCREGDVLDAKQSRLLKLFGIACAEFKIRLLASWGDGDVTVYDE